jgi:hypothetical protein
VTRPWDAQKIPVPYTVVAQNEVAALLELPGELGLRRLARKELPRPGG